MFRYFNAAVGILVGKRNMTCVNYLDVYYLFVFDVNPVAIYYCLFYLFITGDIVNTCTKL